MSNNSYTRVQKALIEHNEEIILDNLGYGIKCLWRNEITEHEIKEYQKEAKKEQRRFKKGLREDETIVFQRTTHLYRTISQLEEMNESAESIEIVSDDILGKVSVV